MALDNLIQHLGQNNRQILIEIGFAVFSASRVKIPIIDQGAIVTVAMVRISLVLSVALRSRVGPIICIIFAGWPLPLEIALLSLGQPEEDWLRKLAGAQLSWDELRHRLFALP